MTDLMSDALISEYQTIVAHLPENASDDEVITALVAQGEWTAPGARTVLMLSEQYGTAILRNALALAAAMNIEDGEAGL